MSCRNITLVLLMGLPVWALALTPSENAFQCYLKKDYQGAIKSYQELFAQYGGSADLYYNLATCYLQLNNIPEARLYAERALLMAPGHKAAKKEVQFIHNRIEPKIDALPPFLLYAGVVWIRDLNNKQRWGYLVLIFSFLLAGMAIWTTNFKTRSFSWYSGLIVAIWFCSLLFYFGRSTYENQPRGVLKLNNALRIAPESTSQELIPLGAGTKVEIIDSLKDWRKVQLENNDEGWLPVNVLTRI